MTDLQLLGLAVLAGMISTLFYVCIPVIHNHGLYLAAFNFIFWFVAGIKLKA